MRRCMLELLAIALVIACHEAGHAGAAQFAGLRCRPFARLPWKVGVAVVVPARGLDPRDELRIALAGPAASAALAALTFEPWPWLGVLSGLVAIVNLVPLPGSDGLRAIAAARRLAVQPSSPSAR
jgi:Zn-dependent protease